MVVFLALFTVPAIGYCNGGWKILIVKVTQLDTYTAISACCLCPWFFLDGVRRWYTLIWVYCHLLFVVNMLYFKQWCLSGHFTGMACGALHYFNHCRWWLWGIRQLLLLIYMAPAGGFPGIIIGMVANNAVVMEDNLFFCKFFNIWTKKYSFCTLLLLYVP